MSEKSAYLITFYAIATISCYGLGQIDHGTMPAIEGDLTYLDIGKSTIGLLNSCVFYGLLLGSLFPPLVFQYTNPSTVVGISCILNSLINIVFAGISDYSIDDGEVEFYFILPMSHRIMVMYVCRFLVGVCQSFPSVYSPVWLVVNIGHAQRGMYMAALQGMLPVGIVLGYVVTSMLDTEWWMSFTLQSVFLMVQAVVFFTMPDEFDIGGIGSDIAVEKESRFVENNNENMTPNGINSNNKNQRSKTPNRKSINDYLVNATLNDSNDNLLDTNIYQDKNIPENVTLSLQIYEIFNCIEFMCTMIALSTLYYIVTGIQFNLPAYMEEYLFISHLNATIVYSCLVLFGMLIGVVIGGLSMDYVGGVHSRKINYLLVLYVVLSFSTGVLMVQWEDAMIFIVLISICLVCGGAFVPIAVNMLLEFVPVESKTLANSVAITVFNLFGYSFPNTIYGYVNESYGHQVAMLFNVLPGALGVVAILYMTSVRSYKDYVEEKDEVYSEKI